MSGESRATSFRLFAGYGAVVCALPYLALKTTWIDGGTLGVADVELMREPSMIALNAVTAGMDLVAMAMAMSFTQSWGMRVPAWVVLPPMWVASGLLARFVLGVPIFALAELLGSSSLPRPAGGPVQPWVYVVVYTGFVGMGLGLTVAFALHARARWPAAFQPAAHGTTRPRPALLPLAIASAAVAVLVAAFELAWAFGVTAGLGREYAPPRTLSSFLVHAIDGSLSLAAAAGIVALVHRGSDAPLWRPIAAAWLGAGSLFAWSLWHLVNVLSQTALLRGRGDGMALFNLLALARLLAGLTIGIVMLFVLAERTAGTAHQGSGD